MSPYQVITVCCGHNRIDLLQRVSNAIAARCSNISRWIVVGNTVDLWSRQQLVRITQESPIACRYVELKFHTNIIGLAYNAALAFADHMPVVKLDDDALPNQDLAQLVAQASSISGMSFARKENTSSPPVANAWNIRGACFAISQDAWDHLGPFAESHPRGMDVEYAHRAELAGIPIINSDVRFEHLGAATEGEDVKGLVPRVPLANVPTQRRSIWNRPGSTGLVSRVLG